MSYRIPFNKPYLTGKEAHYMYDAVHTGKISGNGKYTKKCQSYFETRFSIKKCLLTTSCTDALEMAAILVDIKPGDEVIMPSYTFVSTANAFILRGAKIVFADSEEETPGIDAERIEKLITDKTKAIVPVHYAGVACDMERIQELAHTHNLFVIEDAAQAVDGYYIDKNGNKLALGSIGDLGTYSFHETKNIISGEGGMLAVNNPELIERAEIVWEKGTNRSAFFRGETDKYGWKDIGSSYLPSEIIAAFLWAQLENLDTIQSKRQAIWNRYYSNLTRWANINSIGLPRIPAYATNNAHNFYLICKSLEQRTAIIDHLKENGILSVFHYLSLHTSDYFSKQHDGRALSNSDKFSDCLLRLPFYYEMTESEQVDVIDRLHIFS